jgi:5-methyltetrahydropteroyltriglutamate--homocysteine methyltransferase
MRRSTERILVSHAGTAPRPTDLTDLPAAVKEVVRRQAEVGIDIVNDGELSKPSYTTYIKDRLAGFDGTNQPLEYQDLVEFPALAKRVFGDPGRSRRQTPACTGPITFAGAAEVAQDIENLEAATPDGLAADRFLTAASPGVIALFFRNDFYATREEYLFAIADAMKHEYEAIAAAGIVLQIDCPDLGMGRHIEFPSLTTEEFHREATINVEALNHALAGIPSDRLRMHLCWGNYEGPHHLDVPLSEIIDIVFAARPDGIALEAANPRHAHEWKLFETVELPEGKVLIPGVLESKSNFVEHPELVAQRIGRYASLVGRENVLVGSDCGYGTWVGQAAVDPQVVWAKFAAMAEGARLASEAFWR